MKPWQTQYRESVTAEERAAKAAKAKNRDLLFGVLMAALIAIAFQEMIDEVWDSVEDKSFGFGTIALAAIFSLTTLRFLIGNQMYLTQPEVQHQNGYLWFLDLLLIISQTLTMVFLGGLASTKVSLSLDYSFFELLGVLYALDLVWILTLWLRKKYIDDWKNFRVPLGWFLLNGVMLLILVGSYCLYGKPAIYSDTGLVYLLVINALAFAGDVFLYDHYDVM